MMFSQSDDTNTLGTGLYSTKDVSLAPNYRKTVDTCSCLLCEFVR